MKKFAIYLTFLLLIVACTNIKPQKHNDSLMRAYNERNYFKLNNLFKSIKFNNNPEILLCKAKLDYVFNNPERSNNLINKILNNFTSQFNDTILADLIEMRANNNFRLQDYKSAFNDLTILINEYSQIFDSLKLVSLKEDMLLRKVIKAVPKMIVRNKANRDLSIPIKRDFVGLLNVPVRSVNDSSNFIFDTGANISVISKLFAKIFGVKILPDKAIVNSITGIKIDCELGYCDINIDELEIKNILFLVLEDSLLSFGDGYYVMNGIIGFPVINALKEITIVNDSLLVIPETPHECSYSNFALDNLNPTILVVYKNDSLPFHFDTGADKTKLYSSFYKKYENEIIENFSMIESSFGGAGGITATKVFLIDSLRINAGDNQALLDSIELLTIDLLYDHKYVYGNFGQDYMRNFESMCINFESMYIKFSNNRYD